MALDTTPTYLARIALIGFLIAGCFAVLWPFIGAVLFAFVLWVCTWSFYAGRILPLAQGRSGRAATWSGSARSSTPSHHSGCWTAATASPRPPMAGCSAAGPISRPGFPLACG